MKLLRDLFQDSGGKWDARKIGLTGTALAAPIGGGAMVAMFVWHTLGGATPDFAQLGIGLGSLAGGAGLGSWAHGHARAPS